MDDRAVAAGRLQNLFGELKHRPLGRVADVDRPGLFRDGQLINAVNQVGDIAERAGLLAVAEDRQRLPAQGLADKGRDDAPVIEAHPRPVGVENPNDLGVHPELAAIGERHGLGVALGFVVDGAGAVGVDVAEVFFRLRVDGRVAVDFRGGGHQKPRPFSRARSSVWWVPIEPTSRVSSGSSR